jgi:hypothetical protein
MRWKKNKTDADLRDPEQTVHTVRQVLHDAFTEFDSLDADIAPLIEEIKFALIYHGVCDAVELVKDSAQCQ